MNNQVRIYYKNGRMSEIKDLTAMNMELLFQMIRKKKGHFIQIESPQKTIFIAKSDISHVEVTHE